MQQIEHAPDRGDPGPLLVQVSYIHVTNFWFFRICYMQSRNQHGCIADFGMMVIVGGQKITKCSPEGVCSRINTSSIPSPQMAVFRLRTPVRWCKHSAGHGALIPALWCTPSAKDGAPMPFPVVHGGRRLWCTAAMLGLYL